MNRQSSQTRQGRSTYFARTGIVAISATLTTGNLIELASAHFAQATPSARDGGKARQQQAMAVRLAQLQAALGESASPGDQPPTSQPAIDHGQGPRRHHRWAAGLVSALAGAGLTAWLTAGFAPPTPPLSGQPEITASPTVNSISGNEPPLVVASAPPAITEQQKIADTLEAWRTAWAARDADSYLGFYSAAFLPADGNSREQWAAMRRKKLGPGPQISLAIGQLRIVRLDDRQLIATFRQDYAAGNYRESGTAKTLQFVRDGDAWRIVSERQQ